MFDRYTFNFKIFDLSFLRVYYFSIFFYTLFAAGYIGRKCERCAYGYYGFPDLPEGKCVPCDCNLAGSLSDTCDSETGQCKCKPGSTGRDCSQCTAYRHVYIHNVCTCKSIQNILPR